MELNESKLLTEIKKLEDFYNVETINYIESLINTNKNILKEETLRNKYLFFISDREQNLITDIINYNIYNNILKFYNNNVSNDLEFNIYYDYNSNQLKVKDLNTDLYISNFKYDIESNKFLIDLYSSDLNEAIIKNFEKEFGIYDYQDTEMYRDRVIGQVTYCQFRPKIKTRIRKEIRK